MSVTAEHRAGYHIDAQNYPNNLSLFTFFRIVQIMELSEILYNKAEYIETVRNRRRLSAVWFYAIWLTAASKGALGVGSLFMLIHEMFSIKITSAIMCTNFLQASGNKVSRQSVLCGSQNIVLNGKVRKMPNNTASY